MKKSQKAILSLLGVGSCCIICTIILIFSPATNRAGSTPTENIAAFIVASEMPDISPIPTDIPLPTDTATIPPPTITPTPEPQPIILSGSGDSVVDASKWDGPAIAHITYQGAHNFAVWNDDSGNNHIDLLVNTIGSYDGVVPIDFRDGQSTYRFEITASGPWTIEIKPISQIQRFNFPGTLTGFGDSVILLEGSGALDTFTIDASTATHNFVIWGFGNSTDLLVNEIAPYTGTILIQSRLPFSNGSLILVINASGPWSIGIGAR